MPKSKNNNQENHVSAEDMVNQVTEPEVSMSETSSEIDQLRSQITSLEVSWKRALADYQNLLRRMELEKKEYIRVSSANLISRLVPSLDIIDMAAAHTKDMGVEMAAKQFRGALVEEGLTEILPEVGANFDHNFQECSDTENTTDESKDNTISEVILKGYKLGEYVLRPAKVKVFKLALDK